LLACDLDFDSFDSLFNLFCVCLINPLNVWLILGSFWQQKVQKKSNFDLRTAFNLPIFDGKSFSQEQLSQLKCFSS
jgi:hypothetical protein